MVFERIPRFTDKNRSCFDIELRGRIVVVQGDSGTGKSFCASVLRNKKISYYGNDEVNLNSDISLNELNKIEVFSFIDGKRFYSDIRQLKGKLIIIDNGDLLLDNVEALKYIVEDIDNQYLIFARKPLDLRISPNYYAEMIKKDGVYSLEYKFNEQGWY